MDGEVFIMNNITEKFVEILLSDTYDAAADAIAYLFQSQKNIYIFGAGAAGILVKRNLENFNISIGSFVDNDISKQGTCIEGVPVVGFSDLLQDKNKVIILGTVEFHSEVVQQCIKNGISEDEICYADFLHYDGKDKVRDYFCKNVSSIIDIFSHCADSESRELFVANILYQLNRDRRHYRCSLSDLSKQYFDTEIVKTNDEEVYFDCGAKDGDTAIGFHKARNGKYRKTLAFEPDEENFNSMVRNLEPYKQIIGIKAGVGEREEKLRFNGHKGGHSSFDISGECSAEIVPLDKFISEGPTLIKMDIEGFELQALKGAKSIMKQLKPKLAICVYHKPCDIVELPKYILSQRDDYKIYFRLYREFGHDLVCYCV
jgi:FkbM family methyltransferase